MTDDQESSLPTTAQDLAPKEEQRSKKKQFAIYFFSVVVAAAIGGVVGATLAGSKEPKSNISDSAESVVTPPPTIAETTLAPSTPSFDGFTTNPTKSPTHAPDVFPTPAPTTFPTAHPTVSISDPVNDPVSVSVNLVDQGRGGREERLGSAISLSSDGQVWAAGALGSEGKVEIHRATDGEWDSIITIRGNETGDDFGRSISLSGNGQFVAVGIPKNDNGGRVQVYEILSDCTSWDCSLPQVGNDIQYTPGETNSLGYTFEKDFGYAVSLSEDGSVLAIGTPYFGVAVYRFEGGQWNQMGNLIDAKSWCGAFGWSVSLSDSGSRVAVGARAYEMGAPDESGSAMVFQFVDDEWKQLGQDLLGEDRHDLFGTSISLSGEGNVVAIGAINSDNGNGNDSGHVRIYRYTADDVWTQIGETILGEEEGDHSGVAVSLSKEGTKVAIGSNFHGEGGHVRVFALFNDIGDWRWRQLGESIEGETKSGRFGEAVALVDNVEGKTFLAVGAPYSHGWLYDNMGEAYVYQMDTNV